MAITLADLAKNSGDKIVQGFVNEIITDSQILAALPFDNCMTADGLSDLVYSYKRVKTPMEAKFRALGDEPEETDVTFERITTNVGILSDSFKVDRVAQAAASDLYQLKLVELKNAIIRGFNKQLIAGDKASNDKAFDGLAKAIKGSSTEFTAATDISTITEDSALAFTVDLDNMLSSLMRTPNALYASSAMKVKIAAVCRRLGLATTTPDSVGNQVSAYNGIPIVELKDGALTTNDVYAVCYGLDAFHGITLKGDKAITVNLPDFSQPGAVKTVDAEFVCGCALKATKAAGVLHPAKTGA